jgi:hypothetical protein
MNDYRELQYRGECRACGRTIQTTIYQSIGKNADPEWVRCAGCDSITRIQFERDGTIDAQEIIDNQ